MELTFCELAKRDVINIADGRCLGRITDLKLGFPNGVLLGIIVPGRKVHGFLKIFDRSRIFIEESKIIKIGGDVILVDLKCADTCSPNVRVNKPRNGSSDKIQCPPPCPPPCPPRNAPLDLSGLCDSSGRIDTDDY